MEVYFKEKLFNTTYVHVYTHYISINSGKNFLNGPFIYAKDLT